MHDRRIDGVPTTFGNAGALFMKAMTWYDHATRSEWSQPWGRAIPGEMKGVKLFLLPSQITSWSSWRQAHPDTLVMINDLERLGVSRQRFDEDFVIGLILGEQARAYRFDQVRDLGVVHDSLGGSPILVTAGGQSWHAYLRLAGGQTLTFSRQGDTLIDQQTGSRWDVERGLAVEGALRGELLQRVPSMSAYDWAWFDFYPEASIYAP